MTRGFTAEDASRVHQFFHDVAITDRGALERNPLRLQRMLETEIGHQGTDHATFQLTAASRSAMMYNSNDRHFLHHRLGIHHHHAITVAIEGDPEIGAVFQHQCCACFRDAARRPPG